uniref:Uncharacterized protein n=1 Tax=Arundo donax TaxID=35708 RepID=A0A0A8Y1L3_ARUDO
MTTIAGLEDKCRVDRKRRRTRQLVIKECDASYVPMSQSVQLSMSCDAPEKAVPHEDGHYERPDSHMLDMLNTEMHDVVATVTAGNNSADSSMSGTSYKGDEHDICLQSSEQSSTLQTMRHDSIVGAIDEHGQMRVLDFTAKALSVVDHLGRKHSFVVLCPPLGGVKIAMKKIHRLCCFDSELQFYDSKDISQILSAGALAKWISSTSQSTEFYRNWVEHCEHRLVAVEGIQIKNELFKTQEIGHSICELAFRGFGRMETKMCHKRTKGPCRHFLSPDWAVHALCGEPPREELYKELFVGKHIGYDPLQCRMFTAIVEKDGTYACYTWDFDACRLSILDPGVQNNNVHDYCTKHYGIAIIFMGI